MSQYLFPALFTLFVWWFSTGVIMYLGRLPRWTFKWTLLKFTLLLVFALVGLSISASRTTVASAYCAFTCAVLVWSWQEIAFLLGYVTGARRSECPPDSRGWQRVRHATEAILHHEMALILLALMVPVSVTAATAVLVPLWMAVSVQPQDAFAATSLCLVAGLLTLAVVEHLFMIVPVPTTWMWKWGMREGA